ncbi:alpha/beta fold hydrolase [Larkinella ripae]
MLLSPAWLDTNEYPFPANFLLINGQQQHYIDVGVGEILLFIHGTPSWSFDFRNVIKTLSTHYRCIAMDHIGFGLSDKPETYDYSTQQHAVTLQLFIDSLQIKDLTLVMHDFGGPIGFHYAIANPENIKRLVFLNTWLWSSEGEPAFKKMKRVLKSPLLAFLYTYFNFSAKYLLPYSFGNKFKLSAHIHQHYRKPFSSPKRRKGPLAFAKSLLNDQDWFEQLWNRKQPLIEKPVLLLWGLNDQLVTPGYLRKFQRAFPQAQTIELPDCGHFPQEEESGAVAAGIRTFVRQNSDRPTGPFAD